MSISKRPSWFTSDDMLFSNREDAELHEYHLNRAAVIDEFLHQGEGSSYTDRGKSSALRIVGDFLDFLHRKEAPMPWFDESDEPAQLDESVRDEPTPMQHGQVLMCSEEFPFRPEARMLTGDDSLAEDGIE